MNTGVDAEGEKGDKGDTYELTEQDKQDIADLVDVPEPLKYIKDDPSDNGGVIEGFVELPEDAPLSTPLNSATGRYAHAEGMMTTSSSDGSHAEGLITTSSNYGAHSEGYDTTASGLFSHAEGQHTMSQSYASHSEGYKTVALGYYSHSEGKDTEAVGYYSHASGNGTIARGQGQFVIGEYNIEQGTTGQKVNTDCAFIVGNGTNDNLRSNAYTLDWNGNGVYAGKVTVGTAPTNDMDVATKKYVDDVKGVSIHICTSTEYNSTTRIPTITNPDEKTFYLVPSEDGTSPDLFVEWAYVNNAWEMFGSASIDLSGYLTDVQINGASIVNNGVANIPIASENNAGVVKASGYGIYVNGQTLRLETPSNDQIKLGSVNYKSISPQTQDKSTFYGLAKVAGYDEKDSTLSVGQYTPEAKGAIQSMLGIDSLIAPTETNPFTNAHAIGDLFIINGALYRAKTAIAVGDVLDDGVNVEGVSVDDVLGDYVKNTDYANASKGGVVRVNDNFGILVGANGLLMLDPAFVYEIKTASASLKSITPTTQHAAAFYGLAKASGDTTQSASSNPVGTYTDEAKQSIKQMLGVVDSYDSLVVNVTGTDPVITAQPSYRYNCGEVTTYEMCITDGVYCGVMSWDA